MGDEAKVMDGIDLAWEHHIQAGERPAEMHRVVVAKNWKGRDVLSTNWFAEYPEEFLRNETAKGRVVLSVDVYALTARSR